MRYPRVFEKTAVSGSTYRLTFQDEKSCGVLTTAGGAIHTTCIGIADLHRGCWRELTDHHAEPAAGEKKPTARQKQVDAILAAMISRDERLYETILDTHGFAYQFNELVKMARGDV